MDDYLQAADRFGALHAQIKHCDQLKCMDTVARFPGRSGLHLSDEIRVLQERSGTLNLRLQNRRELSEQLEKFVNQIVVSRALIEGVCEAEVNEGYVQYLVQLHRTMQSAVAQPDDVLAKRDVAPEIERLRLRAAACIRDFLLEKFAALRRPRNERADCAAVAAQVQVSAALFGQPRARRRSGAARDSYVATMSGIYQSTTRTYIAALLRLQTEPTSRHDLLGDVEGAGGASSTVELFSSLFSTAKPARPPARTSVFALGDRLQWMSTEQPLIVPHEAAEKQLRLSYEALFASMHRMLRDSRRLEDAFGTRSLRQLVSFPLLGLLLHTDQEFFGKMELFGSIFDKTGQQYLEHVTEYLNNSYDAIGMYLCVQIASRHAVLLQQRRVRVLQQYYEKAERAAVEPSATRAGAAHSLRRLDARALAPLEPRPHFVTRRLAELLTALQAVAGGDAWADRRLQPLLGGCGARRTRVCSGWHTRRWRAHGCGRCFSSQTTIWWRQFWASAKRTRARRASCGGSGWRSGTNTCSSMWTRRCGCTLVACWRLSKRSTRPQLPHPQALLLLLPPLLPLLQLLLILPQSGDCRDTGAGVARLCR